MFSPVAKALSSMATRYEELVRQLYLVNLRCAVKLGLKNITDLNTALGDPLRSVPNIVHVAGTNGKGSVALKIAKALQYSGLRAGLFVSPHLSSFRERMQVNGTLITEAEVEELLARVLDVRETQHIPATFFEVTTALAFAFFERQRLDSAVIEVGLGGRLDATNIVSPRLSIITSIGLEHTDQLGPTIQHIAKEKAGIIKPGVPVVLGPTVPRFVAEDIAKERASPVIFAPEGPFESYEEENTAIAATALGYLKTVLPISDEAITQGLSCRPPCRFEVLEVESGAGSTDNKVTVVLDVGHNPPALGRLFQRIEREIQGKAARVVIGLSGDKDVQECLRVLASKVPPGRLHLVKAPHPRAAPPAKMAATVATMGVVIPTPQYSYDSVEDGVKAALHAAGQAASRGKEEVVLICGTFFIMADARQALGMDEPRDTAIITQVAGAHFKASQENMSSTAPPPPAAASGGAASTGVAATGDGKG